MRLGTERKNIKVHSSQSNFTVGPIHSKLYLYCLQYKRKKLPSFSSKTLFSGRYGVCSWLASRRELVFPVFRLRPLPHCYESSVFQIIVHQQQLRLVVASILTSCLCFVLRVRRNTFKDGHSKITAGTGLALISDVCDVGVCSQSSIYLHNS